MPDAQDFMPCPSTEGRVLQALSAMEQGELAELLYGEMTGFSFLSKYLYRDDVEEVNINQWDDVKVIYANGEVLPTKERFTSPQHALDVIKRMLHKSGMKQLELQRLKRLAMERPPKIRKFSFLLLGCMLLLYMGVMGYQILGAMSGMF